MNRFLAVNKPLRKHLKIIYSLPAEEQNETLSPITGEEGQRIDFIPDDAHLIGILPGKTLQKYSRENLFYLDDLQMRDLYEEVNSYARERLIHYLSLRERSIAECRSYLNNLPLGKDLADSLIREAIERKYLDERRFAELLTRSYISRHKSRQELKTALINKRIPSEVIDTIMDKHYTDEDKREVLEYHIEKGIRKYPGKASARDYQKCIAYLMRKGFHFDDFKDKLLMFYRGVEE